MFKKTLFVVLVTVVICGSNSIAAPATILTKVIGETVETAAKRSGKVLSPAAKKLAAEALENSVKHFGDDALKIASHGGLEAIECISRYGDDFIRLTRNSPQAARSLALHADELMPIAKRIGVDFMSLEAKVPGLGVKAVKTFGDDAVQVLNKLSANDAAKTIALGCKADSPATAKLLLQKTQQTGGAILKYLDFKKIMAIGLSSAAVIAASKTAGGLAEAVKSSPVAATIGIGCWAIILIALIVLIYWGPTLWIKGWKKAQAIKRKHNMQK